MNKPKRHILSVENTIDFDLIGICTNHSDYRLAWGLNQALRSEFAKSDEPFIIQSKKGMKISEHSFHFWFDEVNQTECFLIKNKSEGKFLIPEKSQIDFFYIIRENQVIVVEEVLDKIKKINSVVAAFQFDSSSIPSCDLLIF